jgi:hypothetical protein
VCRLKILKLVLLVWRSNNNSFVVAGMASCPCGENFEFLAQHNFVGPGGVCTAFYADESLNDDGTQKICNRPLAVHPRDPQAQGQEYFYCFCFLIVYLLFLFFEICKFHAGFKPWKWIF